MRDERKRLILNEHPEDVGIVKVFHLYESRNEWVNWKGDTDLVRRTWHQVFLTLKQAEMSAERRRKQGSKFFIEEVPAIKVSTKSGFMIFTEVFTDYPMQYVSDVSFGVSWINSMENLNKLFPTTRWTIKSVHEAPDVVTQCDGVFFKRSSAPGGGLCWSLSHRKIEDCTLKNIANKLSSLISASTT